MKHMIDQFLPELKLLLGCCGVLVSLWKHRALAVLLVICLMETEGNRKVS
jgi:hypothetical protein